MARSGAAYCGSVAMLPFSSAVPGAELLPSIGGTTPIERVRGRLPAAPTLRFERRAADGGARYVAGIDEVGRGAWAGPLTVAAVVLPVGGRAPAGIRDSKQLTAARRTVLAERLLGWCVGVGVGHAWPEECDRLGMSEAQRLATRRALVDLALPVDHVLVDGTWDFVGGASYRGHVTRIVKGDRRSRSIAAASIVAKATRDAWIVEVAPQFEMYSFETNKGYPCPRHERALLGYGPSSIHRLSWAFMDRLGWPGLRKRPASSSVSMSAGVASRSLVGEIEQLSWSGEDCSQ